VARKRSARTDQLEHRAEIREALQQFAGGNPTGAMDLLRPFADEGDPAAAAVLAWLYTSQGPWNEGLPYARTAARAGIVAPLPNYLGNMLSDPAMRQEAIEFTRILKDAGWPLDPMSYATQTAQTGDLDAATAFVELATLPAPSGARQKWDDLINDVQPAAEEIKASVAAVQVERDRATAAIGDHEARVSDERARMEELVREVTDLANEGAAVHLANEYAKQAEKTETTAKRYTKWAIWAGGAAAMAAGIIAFFAFSKESGVGPVLTKAALALPILAFAGYIARLATIHRQQAWRWRHIELQIRTANPFVSPLPVDQRRILIAALALRFFPGQPLSDQKNDGAETTDPVALLADLFRRPPSEPAEGTPPQTPA
jgi:hypothetical protein